MCVHLDGAGSSVGKHCCLAPSANRNRFRVAARNVARASRSVTPVASAAPESPPEPVSTTRRSGNFPPSAWDYSQISSSTSVVPAVATRNEEYERLKNEIKRLLKVTAMPLEKLELVDSLQQLGIRRHFEKEIQNVLESLFLEADNLFCTEVDLHSTALLFRVLRENGYEVSQDVLKKLLCTEASFSEDHGYNIKGILSLYEASFLGFEGEEILDKARSFAFKYLKDHLESKNMEPCIEKRVRHVLAIPTYWRLTRVQARWSLSFDDEATTMNPIVLEFSKLDYNMVQEIHKREVGEITKWWHNYSLRNDLNFARDRIVESYIWTMGVIFQPKYGDARRYLTQATNLLTIIDDMYDVYASIDEIELFTESIKRWEMNATMKLPKYMRTCLLYLFTMVKESNYHILKEKDMDVDEHIKRLWVDLCKSYLVETRWYHNGHKPLLEEYIENGIISSGVHLAVSYAYIFTSHDASKDVLNSLQMFPNVINWTGKILRLNNDMSTSSKELIRGDVVKAVECYQQERNVSRFEAQSHIQDIIMDTWKRINEERFSTPLQKDVVDHCINICRASHCFYQVGDGYGSPAKDIVMSLLFNSV